MFCKIRFFSLQLWSRARLTRNRRWGKEEKTIGKYLWEKSIGICVWVCFCSPHIENTYNSTHRNTHTQTFLWALSLSIYIFTLQWFFVFNSFSLSSWCLPPHEATDNVPSLPVFWSSSILNKWSKLVGKQEQERKQQKRERRERKRESETEANCMSDVQIFVARQRKIVSSLLEICGKKGWVRLKEGHAATEKKWLINYE